MFTLNCKGKLLTLEGPVIMGILNATPDSFYNKGTGSSTTALVEKAVKMMEEGATILDIGGQSTRPGSERIAAEEEISRVLPVIEAIRTALPHAILSIDTYSSTVAAAAINAGATIVNDISSGDMDNEMIATVAALKVPYIGMHMKGTPANMQHDPQYNDVLVEVMEYFIKKINDCTKAGIKDVIIDPGFGFGKTTAHNFQLLKNLKAFAVLNKPVLAGLSRKGSIYRTLNVTTAEALNGTTVVNTMALMNGASILRVHDVKEASEAITLYNVYKKAP